MKIAVVTAAMRSGERGGAEAFYTGLVGALEAAGHDASPLPVSIDESNFDAVLASYARCYDLDVGAFDVVISTKAPTYMVRHPQHVSYLLHTLRVFYDRFASEYGGGTEAQRQQRALIHRLDRAGLHPSRVRGHFSNGATTHERLFDTDTWWRQIPFRTLHHPPVIDAFLSPRRGEYIFLPGRLHRWKRPDLLIRAFKLVKRDIPLLVAGSGEDEQRLRREADGDPRVRFVGAVTEAQLLDLYAGALVVPFVPVQEDYGLITIEAFKSRKPVITCTDSGETLRFVRDGVTGFVVEPSERALADRLEFLIDRPDVATEMGEHGYRAVAHIAWEPIVSALLDAATRPARHTVSTGSVTARAAEQALPNGHCGSTKVTVLDMQPIEPAVGGGRLRLLGLYHDLAEHVETTYVGTYDWPGPTYRDHRLTSTLREIDIPLSDRHFTASDEWRERTGGKTVIDVSFPLLAHHSPRYVEAARAAAHDADIVVFSHPWVYPLVSDLCRPGQLVVYDAHNVESVLRFRLLGDSSAGLHLVRHAAALERDLCLRADLVLACSHEDRELFHSLYGLPFGKCVVVPNGTFVGSPPDASTRQDKKRALALGSGPVAVFIGSLYPPNVEAVTFICRELAPALPHVTFAICGGVGDAIDRLALSKHGIDNVRITGVVDDSTRRDYLAASDVAVNPMFSGSGTNIKMFDFMAAGLPIISTPTGARGIRQSSGAALHICDAGEFCDALQLAITDEGHNKRLGAQARQLVCRSYSWERVSPRLGGLLTRYRTGRRPAPLFSVIVPTYERHTRLPDLLACLSRQTCADFEIVLVDQSPADWQVPDEFSSLDILYLRTDVRGTSHSRNTGAWFARGAVIAFTDDDCQPFPDWLQNARRYFEDRTVVGIEGLVISDKVHDPDYRAVTNVGFEGIGFMTANLLIRRDTFNAIDGFDEQFDVPFREDTDLGWRASGLGSIPFGHDVRVFHPPHSRAIEREGHAERARFFEKDALLLKKHPDRYKSLFLKEGHYLSTEGFREHFMRGALKYGATIDEFYSGLLTSASGSAGSAGA
jgi:glycosyltransferase involved in cell wall biosynthesis